MRLSRVLPVLLASLTACDGITGLLSDPDAPVNITYQLVPSGDPSAPLGVLLSWDVPRSGRVNSFNVYGRNYNGGEWDLRATTTSPTFHDAGVPERQYYVASVDWEGYEIAESDIVTIDLGSSRLPAPQSLTSISLNSAVQLAWSNNAVSASQGTFDQYRVYSTGYDGSRNVCTADWVIEGTTVSDGFLAGNLVNGVSRCFAITAVTRDGHESAWSESRLDTPRSDARNAVVYAGAVRPDSAGFAFMDDATRKWGVVGAASRGDLDVLIERHQDGTLWLVPARSGVTMRLYSTEPVSDLTAIDRAPSNGFGTEAIEAVPGYAYVFRIAEADGVHFAGVRVAFRTADYVVFDWSYQNAPGNAELNRAPAS